MLNRYNPPIQSLGGRHIFYDKRKKRLRRQLLMLASVPLVFEVFFVLILLYLQHQTEVELRRTEKAQNAIAQVTDVSKLFYDSSTAALMFGITHDDLYRNKYTGLSEQIPGAVKRLRTLIQGQPNEIEAVNNIEIVCKRGVAILNELMASGQFGSYDKRTDLLTISNALVEQTHRVTEMETKLLQTQLPAAQRWRDFFSLWLLFGVIFSIVLSIALVYAFDKRLVNRLSVLLDNTLRFSKGSELHPTLPGNDEIAGVDQCFHFMADSLTEARKREQLYVAMLSHDVRTPLTSATLYLQQLSKENFDVQGLNFRERVSQIADDFVHIGQLLGNLLELQRIKAGKFEVHPTTVSFLSIVEKAFAAVQGLAAHRSVRLNCSSSDTALFADPDRIAQVLVNLLTNATNNSPEGGAVVVDIRELENWHQISVQDSGRGVHPDAQDRIFNIYEREPDEESSNMGTGLGLSICKAIVELHNGEIGIVSEPGRGSNFWFKIPAVD